jgi:Ca2+-binding EF-hand superfamily protein
MKTARTLAIAAAAAAFSMGALAQATPATPATPGAKTMPPGMDQAAPQAAFKKADKNSDGKLSRDEVSSLPAIATKFDDLDKNKDGALDMSEFSAHASK